VTPHVAFPHSAILMLTPRSNALMDIEEWLRCRR